VRRAGQDVAPGTVVAAAGRVVGSAIVALAAAVGRDRLLVRPTPRVVVVSVGDELTDSAGEPRPGAVADVNSYALAAGVHGEGGVAYRLTAAPDDPDELRSLLDDNLIRGDLIVTSGGIGAGEHDTVRAAVARLGHVDFARLAVQPGPVHGFGTVGPDGTPIYCLPGDPVSALVGFELLVRPALRRLAGYPPAERPRLRARLLVDVTDPVDPADRADLAHTDAAPELRTYAFGRVAARDGGYVVAPTGHRLTAGLADANALILLVGETGGGAGDEVDVELLTGSGGVPPERRAS
jgi:molybdopterin molybdotransferase